MNEPMPRPTNPWIQYAFARGRLPSHVIIRRHPTDPKHRRRCPVCNPRANPGRLAIDGHEYRRRVKARKR